MRIKICGITNEADADQAALLGADAIGLNFYALSPRGIGLDKAAAIVQTLPPFVEPVGLFVNESLGRVHEVATTLHLRTVQIHRSEWDTFAAPSLSWIAAFPVRDAENLENINRFLERALSANSLPAAILVDAHVGGMYGGTGQQAPWELLAGFKPGRPLILAGGLTPDNIALAIRTVRPYAVDVASGVESRPGKKDVEKMRRFIGEAREAGIGYRASGLG